MATCPSCAGENPAGFAFCGHCGGALAAPAPPREVRKTVTVVFADVVGSTMLGESRDPERVRAEMAAWFERARRTIELHGGTVEKFVGDAVMAVFGVPVVREDDALRAVRAAHELRAPELRIGVNTGEVVAGEGETLVTGDAVNVAARLEQAATPGEVLIGPETRRLVRDAVQVERLTPLEVKGKAAPVEAYRLMDVRQAAAGVARRLDTPLVGRRRELDRLRQDFEHAVAERSCHLFTLLGAAGVGKTRLAAAFLEGVEARVLHGRCLHYGEGITYFPLVEVLLQFGVDPDSVIGSSTAETQLAFRKLLEREAATEPAVVVFEDLQWAEPTFLDLVEHLADLSRGAPIFVLCIARPELLEARPAWAGGKLNATTILLEPLSEDECKRLIDTIGGAEEEMRTRVVAASQGNPLFVEEMLAMLREGADVSVPPTIRALLQARLETLGSEERAVVERGAVEGQLFHRNAVVELAPETDVDAQLPALVRKELIRPDTPVFAGDDAYRFRHLLIRDAAYETLPKQTRAELHERFALWLEEHAELVEQDEIVGYHLEQAALYRQELGSADESLARRAARRLAAAGRAARARGDGGAAIGLLRRSARLLPLDDPLRLDARVACVSALVLAGRFDEAEEAIAELAASHNERLEALAAAGELELSFHTGEVHNFDEARARVSAAIATLERCGEAEDLANAKLVAGGVEWFACRIAHAQALTEDALAHAEEAGSTWFEARAFTELLGMLAQGPTPLSKVERELDRLRPRAEGRPALEAALHAALASCANLRGDFAEGARHIRAGFEIRDELGQHVYASSGRGFGLGGIAWQRGDYSESERLFRGAYEELTALGERGFAPTLALFLAEAVLKQGRDGEAEDYLAEMRAASNPLDIANDIEGDAFESLLLARRGECDAALELGAAALDRLDGIDAFRLHMSVSELVAEAFSTCGRKREARRVLDQMVAWSEAKEAAVYAEKAKTSIAEL